MSAGSPPGAVFDPGLGLLQWQPSAGDAGVYTDIRCGADDGAQSVSEDITLTVANTRSSLAGVVRTSGGAPLAGAAVKLTGVRPKRTTITNPDGSYRFDDLPPNRYRIRLDKPTRRLFRARRIKVEMLGLEDLTGADITATPR